MKKIDERQEILKIANNYFSYMAKNYPVMSLSDEFYFFPRAKEAVKYLNILDSLDTQKIKQDILFVKGLLRDLEKKGSEKDADYVLLRQSMLTFLREFERVKIHETDPTLYLKILLFGIDHIVSRVSLNKDSKKLFLTARIRQIPRLLDEAKRNLKKVPAVYLEIAQEMIGCASAYSPIGDSIQSLQALQEYKVFLQKKAVVEVFTAERDFVEDILRDSFSYNRNLEGIYEIALCEYTETIKELNSIDENWKELLQKDALDIKGSRALIKLYTNEIKKLKKFFKEKDVISIPETQDILVRETPGFLEPIRASASYSCPLSADKSECGFFYLTINNTINNEYIFLTAHETYPGHHLLDSVRRLSKNPITQQIESPLFYEGWSSYAERLVDQLGYIKDPLQRLAGLKRQAWRAVRAMLDAGIRIDKLKLEDAEEMIKALGYSPKIIKSMIRHYALTPGYQLCYTIGKFEIERLRKKYGQRLGLKKFHDVLLGSGQIPFSLIEKKMEDICRKNS